MGGDWKYFKTGDVSGTDALFRSAPVKKEIGSVCGASYTLRCMALSLSKPKDIIPPNSTGGSSGATLSLTQSSRTVVRDLSTILASTLEVWGAENAVLFQRQLEARGVILEGPPVVHLGLEGHIPDRELLERVLALPRRIELSFVPKVNGAITLEAFHAESGETLHYPCDVEFSIGEKELSDTELGIIRHAFQATLVSRLNALVGRIASERGYDSEASRPVAILVADADLARVRWRPEEAALGYRITLGSDAARLLAKTADAMKPNAREVAHSEMVVEFLPHAKVSEASRAGLVLVSRRLIRAQFSALSRLVRSSTEDESRVAEIVDMLVGMEIASQAAKDPSAHEYQKRVGADPDSIKERARLRREEDASRVSKLTELRAEVRSVLGVYLQDEELTQPQKNAVIQAQNSILASLGKGNTAFALESLEHTAEALPEHRRAPLEKLRATLEGSR